MRSKMMMCVVLSVILTSAVAGANLEARSEAKAATKASVSRDGWPNTRAGSLRSPAVRAA